MKVSKLEMPEELLLLEKGEKEGLDGTILCVGPVSLPILPLDCW